MLPMPSQPTGSFIQDVCDSRPDLYGSCDISNRLSCRPEPKSLTYYFGFRLNPGPFWSLTTLAFTLYVFSSLSSSISAYIANPDVPATQDIGQVSLAAGLVYAYGLGWPALLWGIVRWFGGAEVSWTVVEALAVYGCESSERPRVDDEDDELRSPVLYR